MALRTRALHDLFGVELIDANLTDPNAAQGVEEALSRFGLVLMRDVRMDSEQLVRFAARFGPLQNMGGPVEAPCHVFRVSNLTDGGQMKPAQDTRRLQHDANLLWHVDSSFLSPGATFSFLHGKVIPKDGGDTEFIDGRVAWEALSPATQRTLLPMAAEHSMQHSWRVAGVQMPAGSVPHLPPVLRRLAPFHRPSGRYALAVPSHVERIAGRGYDESQALVRGLIDTATAREQVYSHQWRVGDLLIWDNRCMLHRATPYRAFEQPRDLNSCRVIDVLDESLAGPNETEAALRQVSG